MRPPVIIEQNHLHPEHGRHRRADGRLRSAGRAHVERLIEFVGLGPRRADGGALLRRHQPLDRRRFRRLRAQSKRDDAHRPGAAAGLADRHAQCRIVALADVARRNGRMVRAIEASAPANGYEGDPFRLDLMTSARLPRRWGLTWRKTYGVVTPDLAVAGRPRFSSRSSPANPEPPISEVPISSDRGRKTARVRRHAGLRFYNPIGSVHGGWAATLLNSRSAARSSPRSQRRGLDDARAQGQLCARLTKDTGLVRAEGRVIHRGRTVATSEGDSRTRGKLYAHATTTCMIFPAKGSTSSCRPATAAASSASARARRRAPPSARADCCA